MGYRDVIRLYKEENFTPEFFTTAVEMHAVELQFYRKEIQNSIGIGERYHIPSRRVYRLARERYPSLPPEVRLCHVVKSLNDTMEGLIPSLLVFGTVPIFQAGNSNDRDQEMPAGVIRTAPAEMENDIRVTHLRGAEIKTASRNKVLLQNRTIGSRILRTKSNIGGPVKIGEMSGKLVTISDERMVDIQLCSDAA